MLDLPLRQIRFLCSTQRTGWRSVHGLASTPFRHVCDRRHPFRSMFRLRQRSLLPRHTFGSMRSPSWHGSSLPPPTHRDVDPHGGRRDFSLQKLQHDFHVVRECVQAQLHVLRPVFHRHEERLLRHRHRVLAFVLCSRSRVRRAPPVRPGSGSFFSRGDGREEPWGSERHAQAREGEAWDGWTVVYI